jgi:hypothetical protein
MRSKRYRLATWVTSNARFSRSDRGTTEYQ